MSAMRIRGWCGARRWVGVALYVFSLAVFTLAGGPAGAQSPGLPPAVTGEIPGLSLRGAGTMRFFGLKVYDIRLWTRGTAHSYAEPFALELAYDLGLKGAEIAKRSVEEMARQENTDTPRLARWASDMARIFPDVRKGDVLVGVSIPGKETRFYSRDKLLGTVPDAGFASAFFDIWLAEKTSEPGLRKVLLGPQ
jgi:hypothetical protein